MQLPVVMHCDACGKKLLPDDVKCVWEPCDSNGPHNHLILLAKCCDALVSDRPYTGPVAPGGSVAIEALLEADAILGIGKSALAGGEA